MGVGTRGFHKDCRYSNRTSYGPDYQPDYNLYRLLSIFKTHVHLVVV